MKMKMSLKSMAAKIVVFIHLVVQSGSMNIMIKITDKIQVHEYFNKMITETDALLLQFVNVTFSPQIL